MPTPKENFLRLMRNDHPVWLGDPWSCFIQGRMFRPLTFDAVTMASGDPTPGQMGVRNAFGVYKNWPAGEPGAVPDTQGERKLIKDVTCWRDFVQFPDLDTLDWGPALAMMEENLPENREDYLLMCPSLTGMFEFAHDTMGFEDALVNLLLEPEDTYDLLSAYTDWKIQAVGKVIDIMHPDILHSHDDWGSKKSLMMSPQTWREMFKPLYERFYGYVKSRGVIVMHHNDSVSHEICEDMVDLGIDIWQGVIPQNDIPGIIERTGGRLCLMGGIDMAKLDFPDTPEEVIRAEVRRSIDDYMPLGSFMPCVPNIVPIYKRTEQILNDELDRYGAEYAAKHF